MKLDPQIAGEWARIALGHVTREYPHKLDQVLLGDDDLAPPRVLHPIFFGSFDWHSCVHGWWSLLTLRRLFPNSVEAARIASLADDSFTPVKVAAELAFLDRPYSATFERPYGWGWLLYLHLEATRHADRHWAALIEPLARAFADRFKTYLPKLTYPIRVGTHFNTAFGLVLALEWADRFDAGLAVLIRDWAAEKYSNDRDCQAWEPGGDEFLSSALIEALCMARALPADRFGDWLAAFLPRLSQGEPISLFTPAFVSDRSDGKIAHLDGVNLSRSWCWRILAQHLEGEAKTRVESACEQHLAAALPHLAGDYMGEHWLVSFALLAIL
ncbi:DUF2891 domain-containing protein [Sphingomonas alba]|uniref:DUF2891 domain-containing protein n=1 Tax=Sphingomonas alba TaxID=2908208 RepID=A0ABT0RJ95_9SPHN|nr:DUF2891 domain-containing protein [Sphingomonas alba]MCL6682682.1 DUF2891 domain-containing protein [Sphingomonas alba]